MENPRKFLPVNWVDGMKLNKDHFLKENLALTALIANTVYSQLNPYNYGVLPNWGKIQDFKVYVSTDNQNEVKVRFSEFRAITSGGHLIEMDYDTIEQGCLSIPLPKIESVNRNGVSFFVVLRVNPFEKKPYGIADLDELPPRLPSSIPSYSLHVLAGEELNQWIIGESDFPIGKLHCQDGSIVVDECFIPPCSTTYSHQALLDLHAEMEKLLGKLEVTSIQIIKKIIQKKQQNDMALIVQRICEQIHGFTAQQLGSFGISKLIQPPVFLFESIISLSRLIKNTLDIYEGSGKEELLNYWNDWCDIKKGEMEAQLATVANLKYNHQDIYGCAEKIRFFSRYIDKLFTAMAKLEYIGKRKDAGIFVKEHQEPKVHSSGVMDSHSVGEAPAPVKRKSFFIE